MKTNIETEIDKKLEELDIIEAIENKDVPYVIEQIKALIVEFNNKAWEAYDKAGEAYIKTSKACAPQIEKLHKEEHPDCPWNGETIFSKVDYNDNK